MSTDNYDTMHVDGGRHVKMWTRGVPVEPKAQAQLREHRARCRSSTAMSR